MRRIRLILLLLIISFMLPGCSDYNKYNSDNTKNEVQDTVAEEDGIKDRGPVKGGMLKLFSTKPDTLNPLLTKNIFVKDFSNLIFESLFKLDKDQKVLPVLADKWEVSSDGLIWTFHLRDNVLWHDGMPLTADDLKFTLETIQNSSVDSVYKKNVENIAVFAVVNRSTFRIFLKKSDSFTREQMTFPIIPRHYFTGENITRLDSGKNMLPLGTGPYKYVSGSGTTLIKLAANEKWWNSENKDNPELSLPYIPEIDIKIYNSEKDAISAFQTADIDVAPVQTGDFVKYTGRSDLIIRKYTDKNYEFIAMNLENTVLKDKVVRQAIAGAIDKTAIINEIIPGEAAATDIPVIPNTWLNNTNTLSYSPDSVKAKELLLQNGWKEDKGVMYKKINGARRYLRFQILVNDYNETRSKVAKKLCEQLKEIGMELIIKNLSWNDELKAIKSRKFDMALMGCKVPSVPDISFAYSSVEAASGFNVSGFKNQQVDSYLEQLRIENDQDNKKAVFLNMKNIITDEVPYIGLYFYNSAVLYNKRVRGDLTPYIWDKYYNIVKWYIPEDR